MDLDLKPALLIINPVSGKKQIFKHLPQLIRSLMDAGYIVTSMVTGAHGEAEDFACRLGGSYELICCTGGDGTFNQVLSGVAKGGHDVPIGYIPCGSTNDFAAAHGLSTDIPTASRRAATGSEHRYDIGRFGDKYFSYVAAFGAFSWLSYTTDQNLKNLLGHTAYILDGIKDLPKIKPWHLKLSTDNAVYEGDYLFGAICNTTSIAGTLELPASKVDYCDGRFEVLLIKVPKTLAEFEQILRAVILEEYPCPFIEFFHTDRLHIENTSGPEWSLDGEPSGQFESTDFEVIPGFLRLKG